MIASIANVVPSKVKSALSSNSPEVPARTTLPEFKSLTFAVVAIRLEIVDKPAFKPVTTPVRLAPLLTIIGALKLTVLLNVAAVPVTILSVDATPINPVPSPTK